MEQTAKKVKVKTFPSKYPFKQESRNGLDILYEGPIDLVPKELETHVSKLNQQELEITKFVIIYESNGKR